VRALEVPRGWRPSRLDKVLWPPGRPDGPAYTKRDYLRYLLAVAPYLLPHLRGRPLVLTRYPDGVGGKSFYQKDIPASAPGWLPRFRYTHRDGRVVRYLLVDAPDRPDRVVVDLDPVPPAGFEAARAVALALGKLLRGYGVASWAKTSGATGIHLLIPVRPERTPTEVTAVLRAVGEGLVRLWPQALTLERSRARRAAPVYFDYLQNSRGHTVVAPYSPRARPGAPVSTPVSWEELPAVEPEAWDLRSVPQRLVATGDAARGLLEEPRQGLEGLERLARDLAPPRIGRPHRSPGGQPDRPAAASPPGAAGG
jgi:bifunctional non-homologous end joining protein LigD